MTHKTHDLAVKTGTYTDRNGAEKGRWMNVGSVLETNDGGKVILLNRTFNPAGVPNPENRDTVMLSMFEPKSDQQQAPSEVCTGTSRAERLRRPGCALLMSWHNLAKMYPTSA
jgi:hypothetical protein